MTESSDRLVRRVSLVASAALALMLVATVVYIGWPRVAKALGVAPSPAPRAAAYAANQPVDVPASWYSEAPATLILFARASCGACEKAQPFLKSVVEKTQAQGGAVAMVMAHPPGAEADDRGYAKSLGIAEARTFVVPPGLRVRATPTLLLVNQQGLILHAWEGVGKEETQAAILNAIAK